MTGSTRHSERPNASPHRGWAGATRWLAALAVGLAVLVFTPTGYAMAGDNDVVKYYTVVASYQGAPENLTEIAGRFLGATSRSTEIFDLNVGRRQPDGGSLTDPSKLTAGWSLVLPWDAVGTGVNYGVLPTAPPKPPGTPSAAATGNPGSRAGCTTTVSTGQPSDWAAKRLALDQAWPRTRGQGVMVAIVDSGVDASLPQLSGHIAVGADIVAGTGDANTDCVGSGTAMASLVVAQPTPGGTVVGVAPESTVMPIRVVTSATRPTPTDQATAIEVAVSTGATVVAIGFTVDAADPAVARALSYAASHDVVVVLGAPVSTAGGTASGQADPADSTLLWVGGIGTDNGPAAAYQPGMVDVVAPGVNVTYLGMAGTGAVAGSGTSYAVALVAGEAALIRSAFPDLDAPAVIHRVQATADRLSTAVPDQTLGWGIINPGASVTMPLREETRRPTAAPARAGSMTAGGLLLLLLAVIVGLGAVTLVVLRLRRMRRGPAAPGEDEEFPEPDPHLAPRDLSGAAGPLP